MSCRWSFLLAALTAFALNACTKKVADSFKENPADQNQDAAGVSYDTVHWWWNPFGYKAIKSDGKWGVIDSMGNMVVPPMYENIEPFYESGLAKAKLNGYYGYIDKIGSVIVPFIYTEIQYFHPRIRKVKKDGSWD